MKAKYLCAFSVLTLLSGCYFISDEEWEQYRADNHFGQQSPEPDTDEHEKHDQSSDGERRDEIVYGSFTDTRDNQEYKTIVIDGTTWMAENLNYKTGLQRGVDYYEPEIQAYDYGYLYPWGKAVEVCPAGWHLPEEADFNKLMKATAGDVLAVCDPKAGWQNDACTNASGFGAKPVGMYDSGADAYSDRGSSAYFWAAEATAIDKSRVFKINSSGYFLDDKNKADGLSIRCVAGEKEEKPLEYNEITDSRDGQTYKTVQIGKQTWMAENMRYGNLVHDSADGRTDNDAAYGYLYTWNMAQYACPSGWHLPSKAEFEELVDFIGTHYDAAAFRDTGWNNGTNKSGFGALPAGSNDAGSFGQSAKYWSVTPESYNYYYLSVYNNSMASVEIASSTKAYSVRCIVDGRDLPENKMRDDAGNTYRTVVINGTTWMAENMRNDRVSPYYHVNNDSANDAVYGYLYTWDVARDVCPAGWRLPTKEEFVQLNNNKEKEMTDTKYLRDYSWANGTNTSGFKALPAGKFIFGEYQEFGMHASFWSGTVEYYAMYAFEINAEDDYENAIVRKNKFDNANSVRCVKGTVQESVQYDAFTDTREDPPVVYKTVKIGNQTWMAENMRYNKVNQKAPGGNSANVERYGSLYTWNEAQTACPAGWHLPSEDEFQQLYDLSCSVNDVSPDFTCYSLRDRDWKNGGNITGFGALPAGYRIEYSWGEERFEEFEQSTLFWTLSQTEESNGWTKYFGNDPENKESLNFGNNQILKPSIAMSVRCIKDPEN